MPGARLPARRAARTPSRTCRYSGCAPAPRSRGRPSSSWAAAGRPLAPGFGWLWLAMRLAIVPTLGSRNLNEESAKMLQTGLPWTDLMDRTGRVMRASEIRDLLALAERPEVISFAGGLPAPELFPVDQLRAAFDAALREDGRRALQYGPTPGLRALRELLAGMLARRGIRCAPD